MILITYPLPGPLEGVGPKNPDFFVMGLPASKSLCPAPTTGTLIVNLQRDVDTFIDQQQRGIRQFLQ